MDANIIFIQVLNRENVDQDMSLSEEFHVDDDRSSMEICNIFDWLLLQVVNF